MRPNLGTDRDVTLGLVAGCDDERARACEAADTRAHLIAGARADRGPLRRWQVRQLIGAASGLR